MKMFLFRAGTIAAAILCGGASIAASQTRPFLYTLAPATGKSARAGAYSDVAYGRNLFAALGPDALEQRVSCQVPLFSRLNLVAQVGWLSAETSTDATVQGEVLADFAPAGANVILAAGVGAMQDYGRTTLAQGRLVAGYRWLRTLAVANVRFEHAFASSDDSVEDRRDALDVVSTIGVSRDLSTTVRVGVESVAEDLEGLVEADEAEGGAKLMVGPSLAFGRRDARWSGQITGGPVVHLTRSSVSGVASTAPRDLTSTGFVLRASVGWQW